MKNQNTNAFEETAEIVGWIQIFLSPFIISLILAIIIYVSFDSIFSVLLSVFILIIGIFVGIKIANKIYKSKNGTMHFVARVSASPELDIEKKEIKK